MSELLSSNFKIEKCSESIGIILVLVFKEVFFNKFQPQIIDSLFAIRIFLLILIMEIVGCNPAIPGIAETVISDFFFNFIELKLFNIFILFFLNLCSIFLNIFLSVMTKILGLYFFICLDINL